MNFKNVFLIASLFPLLCFAGVKDELEKECMASTQSGIPAMQRGYTLTFKTNAEFQAARVDFCENGAKKWQAYSSKIIDARNAETKLAEDQRVKDEQMRQQKLVQEQQKLEQAKRDFDSAYPRNAANLKSKVDIGAGMLDECMKENSLMFDYDSNNRKEITRGTEGAAEYDLRIRSSTRGTSSADAKDAVNKCLVRAGYQDSIYKRRTVFGTSIVTLQYKATNALPVANNIANKSMQAFKPEWQTVLTELKDKTNVRNEPKADAPVATQLQPGARVEIETQQGSEWYKVRDMKTKSVLGYISEKRIIFDGH